MAKHALREGYPVSSIGHAIELLELFVDRTEVRLSDVEAALHIAPSTAHRLLAMFRNAGYIEQDRRYAPYRVAPRLASLGAALSFNAAMRSAIRPQLLELAEETRETVHLALLREGTVQFVDSVQPRGQRSVESGVGRFLPAYATAAGKSLLAFLSEAELEQIYPEMPLRRLTRFTLCSRAELLADLLQTRERGYAVNRGESLAGVSGYALPLRGRGSLPIASLVVTAPTGRARRSSADGVIAALKFAACAAERSLG